MQPTTLSDHLNDAIRHVYLQMSRWLPEDKTVLDLYPYFDDYKRVRRGRKHYGFVPKVKPNDVVVNYYCSWPEADRRFKLMLITRRMMR